MLDFNDAQTPPPQDLGAEREAIRAELLVRLESVLFTLFPAGKKRRGRFLIGDILGSPGDSPALHNLIQQASAKGIVFFGAAGNQPVTTPVYPAAYPEVIAVTAGDHTGQIADYANRGSFVDIMAPGTSVVPFNGQSYVISGTSTATAYASGIAAGLADANQNCPPGVISTMRSRLGVKLGQ